MRAGIRSPMLLLAMIAGAQVSAAAQTPARFEVTVSAGAHPGPLTGRLVVVVAQRERPEPRLTISPSGPAMYGVDLTAQRPGQAVVVDETAVGYPGSLAELPPGEYFVQAVVNVYDQVRRADGRTLWLPMNDGRIEVFTTTAGNLHSDVTPVTIAAGQVIRLEVNRVLPERPRPADTEWVQRVSIPSRKLSAFWGRPTFVHATVLLPRDYATSSATRYPAIYTLGHNVPFRFTTDSSGRGIGEINPVTGVETGFDFSKAWRSDDFPRVVAISLEQQTPYFPDSYSVNSANNGPYGDAFVEEVVPFLERHFRLIREPWARHLEGASTSGWQSLALILRNPDFFGGAWILQPDPIDFRRYQLLDIYQDDNAFTIRTGPFTSAERPFRRTVEGQVVWTVRQMSRFEAVLGSRGRSGYQLNAWEAVYGPPDADGYPRPLWDKLTGAIDRDVANYMREQGYDLREYAERHWDALGSKLVGKLHFSTPDMDDFYLNLAVYRFEEFLSGDPRYHGAFVYGRPMKGHSWHDLTWADLVRRIADVMNARRP